MTTIAYDGKLLCTDSLAVGAYKVQRAHIQKIYTPKNSQLYCAIAVSGNLGDMDKIIDWIVGCGERPVMLGNSGFSAIAIDNDDKAWVFDSSATGRFQAGTPESRGTGDLFAMGAMLAGASAYRAIEISSRLDEYTGGTVQCYDIKNRTLVGFKK